MNSQWDSNARLWCFKQNASQTKISGFRARRHQREREHHRRDHVQDHDLRDCGLRLNQLLLCSKLESPGPNRISCMLCLILNNKLRFLFRSRNSCST